MNRSWIVGSVLSLGVLVDACSGTNDGSAGEGSAGATNAAGNANASGTSSGGSAGRAASNAGAAGAFTSGGGSAAAGSGGSSGASTGASTAGNAAVGGAGGAGGAAPMLPAATPATVLLDGATLKATQQALAAGTAGTTEQQAAFKNLIAAADIALQSGTWSVTTKAANFVVKGDPHEYVSWGPYWWPKDAEPPDNAGTFGKCPYVSHDGVHNPDVAKVTDRHGLHASSEAIFELSLAWYFTGNTAYADQAERVARAWYLEPATAMNPSMAYAQSDGPCGAGTATGIIEASGGYLTDTLDGLAILALDTRASGWTATDQAGMKTWLGKFVDFLKTSSVGKAEAAAGNNHGTWYDALLSSIYLFTGDTANAKSVVTTARSKRIDPQIEGDGRMPLELARPTSWHYSNYNAAALCRLAGVAMHVGLDLWGYTNPKGGSIVKAIDYLLPTAITKSPPGPWAQYKDITSPFDAAYQAESWYSIHADAVYGKSQAAAAVFASSPPGVTVPGHFCAGDRFPLGSDFCAITPGAAPFEDLQADGASVVDMWPLIPTCRVPIN